ncbi:MAG TPA: hypothetical protein VGI25_08825, partial [Candidatus Udaeobacter sp.]
IARLELFDLPRVSVKEPKRHFLCQLSSQVKRVHSQKHGTLFFPESHRFDLAAGRLADYDVFGDHL